MRGKLIIYSLWCVMFVCLLCGCESEMTESQVIQLNVIQDIVGWNSGVVWNSEEDILVKKNLDNKENSIFQEPFYEKDVNESVMLQYIEANQLYYIRTFESQYYELCCMDLTTYENTILYTNCSEAERKYDYLGIQDKSGMTLGEREDISSEVVQRFCRRGKSLYLLIEDTLYRMNEVTKYKAKLVEGIDSDSELVFWGSKVYYKDKDKILMEYDLENESQKKLSNWMVQKICYSGEKLLVQRMNGELYQYGAKTVLEKVFDEPVHLLQGDEKNFYCLEQNSSRLVVYNADTLQQEKVIAGKDIWGATTSADEVIYYLEAKGDYLALEWTKVPNEEKEEGRR